MGFGTQWDGHRRGRTQMAPRLYFKVVCIMVFISIATFSFRDRLPSFSKKHVITTSDLHFEASLFSDSLDEHGFLNPAAAAHHCSAHNWEVFPDREGRRKIFDLVMVNTELDWLEIRLNELHSHVDYFVILESATTFTGHPKNLTFAENRERFQSFDHQIIYHLLQDPPDSERAWDHEFHQRNAMYTQVLPFLTAPKAPNGGDVILVSDLDEIPRPATLTLLRNCAFPLILTLRSKFYYYSFQWLHRGQEWAHPQATTYTGQHSTILPHDLRSGRGPPTPFFSRNTEKADLWNAAWHCSSCFSAIAEMKLKMQSFSHTELNKEKYRQKEWIVEHVRKGLDLWGRWGQWYKRVEGNKDIPGYLRIEQERFGYLLNRDGVDAGFVDYEITA